MTGWWERLWINQLWRLHLWHVARSQGLRRRLREVQAALTEAQVVVAEQVALRLEAEAREAMAAHVAAEMGVDAMARWLNGEHPEGS